MAVFLGLAAAIGFGGSDFLGGHAARRSKELSILAVVQVVGLAISAALVAVDGAPFPPARDVVIAALAGICGVSGLGLLYRALATGRMGVAAPVSAVLSSVFAVAWGFGQGERPSAPATVGVVLALIAVTLVARTPDSAGMVWTPSLVLAICAGVLFGVTVVGFSETAHTGMWPVLFARAAATPVIAVAVLLTRTRPLPHPDDRRSALGSGILDVSGNAALIAGFQRGLTSLVAPIAALFPAITIGLARVVLGEALTRHQMAGVALALVGLTLIAS